MKNFNLKKTRWTKGFTLIELLIYMGMLGIILAVLTTLFATILNVQLESESVSSVQQDGRFLISRLTYDIQRAQAIVSPATLGQASNNAALTINNGTGNVTYTYAMSGGNVVLTNDLGSNALNSYNSSVSALLFTRVGNTGGKNGIQVSFTLTSNTNTRSGKETKNFQTTITTR